MAKSNALRLKEIIWEITSECKNGCSYCGSKSQWNKVADENTIREIVKEICKFPPEQIDISGGDPLLVSLYMHEHVVHELKKAGVVCKIIINPKSLNKDLRALDILALYDWIGISINTEEDIEYVSTYTDLFKKSTIITNFSKNNLYMFETIREYVKNWNLTWQVQYTISDKTDENIYDSKIATEQLFEKLQVAMDSGIKLIPADSLNCGACSAGINSLGILSNGDVVPCLSMRSWFGSITNAVVGNISSKSNNKSLLDGSELKWIWVNKFIEQRFGDFFCCKDQCKNKGFEYKPSKVDVDAIIKRLEKTKEEVQGVQVYGVNIPFPGMPFPGIPPSYPPPALQHYVYGVTPGMTMMYGTFMDKNTIVYAVAGAKDLSEFNSYKIDLDICKCKEPITSTVDNKCRICGGIIK